MCVCVDREEKCGGGRRQVELFLCMYFNGAQGEVGLNIVLFIKYSTSRGYV